VTVGGILGEAWRLYTKFFTRFFLIAAIVFLIINLVGALLGWVVGTGSAAVLVALIAAAVSLVGTFWLQGALVYAVDDVRDGRIDSSIGDLFERVRPYLGTLILAGILAGLGIALGLVLLIVPGLILLTWWCLIAPVIVLERKPVGESFGRSRELVRGHGWTVFGIIIIVLLASAIASGVIQSIFSFLNPFFRYWIGGTVANAIVDPFLAIALTLMYFHLRESPATAAPVAPEPPAPETAPEPPAPAQDA
jgi:ABC-type multidrug transport system fused ATPase/permease subunit